MKKTHLLIMCLSLVLLTACQEAAPAQPRKSAEEMERERAQAVSRINIEVVDDRQTREITFSAGGLLPLSIEAKVGQILKISNSLDKQANLYTTSDGASSCEVLGPTIEIPGGQSKQINLDKPFQCTIINQENTDQKAIVKVE